MELVITFFQDSNIFGTIIGRLAGIPVISTRRNLGYWHTPNQIRILRILNKMTHRWLTNSEAVRQYTSQVEHVPLDRITVIRNAIDIDRFHPATAEERQTARRRFGLHDSGRVIASVANLRPVKDHRTLLNAFALVRASNADLQLVLAGKGDEESSLRALAADLGTADRVHFLGSLEDTVPVYHAADAAILSSVSESLPNAIMEALACGLPVAATDVGGVPELLADQPFGRLAPPSNPEALAAALTDLLSGPAHDPAAKEAARTFAVTNFSLPVILEQWYAFLEQVRDETRR